MKKLIATVLILSMVIVGAPLVEAQTPQKKLLRGVTNAITGWVELPKNIYDTSVEENIVSGLTVGTIKGFGMAIVRTGAGVYEVVTFPFDIPEDYVPILDPEYVFSEGYTDTFVEENIEVIEVVEPVE